MQIHDAKFITPASIFKVVGVSDATGNKRLRDLESQGEINPAQTSAGRRKLSIHEAKRLADAL